MYWPLPDRTRPAPRRPLRTALIKPTWIARCKESARRAKTRVTSSATKVLLRPTTTAQRPEPLPPAGLPPPPPPPRHRCINERSSRRVSRFTKKPGLQVQLDVHSGHPPGRDLVPGLCPAFHLLSFLSRSSA